VERNEMVEMIAGQERALVRFERQIRHTMGNKQQKIHIQRFNFQH
jgi:hypothetical protein